MNTPKELIVSGYTDAGFQTDIDDSRSQSGYVFCLKKLEKFQAGDNGWFYDGGRVVVALEAAKDVVWIRKFISKLDVVPSVSSPLVLFCDNNGAIAQAKDPRSH